MTLYKQTAGHGPDLVLLHGWGLHGGLFSGLADTLSRDYRVTCIDLPGHGHSRDYLVPGNLQAWGQAVMDAAPLCASWLGWSLGGLLVQHIAHIAPHRCARLVLSNTTAKFITGRGWPHAQKPDVLARFADDLQSDYRVTVKQFLALQVQRGVAGRAVLRTLRNTVFAHGDPHPAGLIAGLEILRTTDLRTKLQDIGQATQVFTGRLDRLTPPSAGEWLAQQLPDARLHIFPHAAHAPFLSHKDAFILALRQFLSNT